MYEYIIYIWVHILYMLYIIASCRVMNARPLQDHHWCLLHYVQLCMKHSVSNNLLDLVVHLESSVPSRVAWHDWLRITRNISSAILRLSLLTPQFSCPYIIVLFFINPNVTFSLSHAAVLTCVTCC